jgi:hypothetical protein
MPPTPTPGLNKVAGAILDRLGAQRDLPVIPHSDLSWLSRLSLNLPDIVVAGVVLLGAVTLLAVILRLRGAGKAWDMREDAPADGAEGPEPHLARAEAFAQAHRFVEAMHELLLQGLADIRSHSAGGLDASLTSREILRRAKLPPAARDQLGGIIAQVEWTYFGLRPAGEAAWAECRDRFFALRAALAAPA